MRIARHTRTSAEELHHPAILDAYLEGDRSGSRRMRRCGRLVSADEARHVAVLRSADPIKQKSPEPMALQTRFYRGSTSLHMVRSGFFGVHERLRSVFIGAVMGLCLRNLPKISPEGLGWPPDSAVALSQDGQRLPASSSAKCRCPGLAVAPAPGIASRCCPRARGFPCVGAADLRRLHVHRRVAWSRSIVRSRILDVRV